MKTQNDNEPKTAPENTPSEAGAGCPEASCSVRIFSGPESEALWDEINSIDYFATPSQIGSCLYSIGCKLQELEAQFHRQNAKAEVSQ